MFYDNQTYVCIYEKDNNPVTTSPWEQVSIDTTWEAANGFAYIFDDSSSLNDTQINTYINVFAGDINLATYFDPNPVPDIYRDQCTYRTIGQWVDKAIHSDGTLDINFSGSLEKNYERDNSVLSLLNPMLWDAIFKEMSSLASSSTTGYSEASIQSIDLSNNNLRIVPNIASIPNKSCDGWMFQDTSNYPNVLLQMNDEGSTRRDESWLFSYTDGCIKNINLSHNSLTYFNFYSYRPFDESFQWFPTDVNQTIYHINFFTDYPSLLTLVDCRYDSLLQDIYDYQDTKPGYNGVNIDYNYLPYLMFPLTQYQTLDDGTLNKDYAIQYTVPMMQSWEGIDIPQVEDFDYCLGRCYLTYTCYNYYDPNLSVVDFAENLVGMGVYQIDNLTNEEMEMTNYCNYVSLYSKTFASESLNVNKYFHYIKNVWLYSSQLGTYILANPDFYNNYLFDLTTDFFTRSGCASMTLAANLFPSNILDNVTVLPNCEKAFGDDTKGKLILDVYYTKIRRGTYLPNDFHLQDDATITDVFNALLQSYTYGVNGNGAIYELFGFKKDYSSIVILGLLFSICVCVFLFIVISRFISKIHIKRTKK